MEDLRIVPAETAELLFNIEALADDIWHEHYAPLLGEAQVNYMLEKFQSVDAINSQIMSGTEYFVLMYEYLMAGYIGMKEEADALLLDKLYIHEECRGHHIATNVLNYLIGVCKKRGLNKIWLTCNQTSVKTLDILKHLGFVAVKEQTTEIGNGFVMNECVMEYKING